MKICLVNNILDPFGRGSGTEKIVKIIKDGLKKEGYDVFSVSLRPFISKKPKLKNSYFLKSFFFNLNKMPLILKLFWHLFNLFNLINFIKIFFVFKKEKPDLIITNNLMGIGLSVPILIKILKIKHIHILHDVQLIHPRGLLFYGEEKDLENFYIKIYSFFTKVLISSPDYIISPSRWILNIHRKNNFFLKSEKEIILNPALINLRIEKNKQTHEVFTFLFVGQIEKHKGLDLLIKSFQKLQKEFSFIYLKILGAGSMLSDLKSKNLKNIYFLGRKNSKEVENEMFNSDCLVVPSLCYENSPTVIYEAFSANLLVLASDLGGIPELLVGKRGFLFKAGSFYDLYLKMKNIQKKSSEYEDIILRANNFIIQHGQNQYIKKLKKIIDLI